MNKLAIVIPFYKIDFFEETLKSVSLQTNKHFTLYIGNDASSNDPKPMIEKYFESDSYYYFNYSENLGGKNLVLQWERIMKNISEEWFQILGDDDMLPFNFVDKFYTSLHQANKEKINVIKFPLKIIDEENNCYRKFSFRKSMIDRYDFLTARSEHSILSSLSENIFRTQSFLKYRIRQFPLAWHSDDCMIFEYAENHKILYIEETFVFVRMSKKNISSQTDNAATKAAATNEFYVYIIANYYKKFSSEQKIIILKNLKKHFYYTQHKLNIKTLLMIYSDNFINGMKLTKYLF